MRNSNEQEHTKSLESFFCFFTKIDWLIFLTRRQNFFVQQQKQSQPKGINNLLFSFCQLLMSFDETVSGKGINDIVALIAQEFSVSNERAKTLVYTSSFQNALRQIIQANSAEQPTSGVLIGTK